MGNKKYVWLKKLKHSMVSPSEFLGFWIFKAIGQRSLIFKKQRAFKRERERERERESTHLLLVLFD